jgi:acyl-CoA thioesterase FadM
VTSSSLAVPAVVAALAEPSSLEIRPRYEGSNICTWIGFKHVNYLVEEAVYHHLREAGLPAGKLYEEFGLCTDIVDLDTRVLHAVHIDDVARAEVKPARRAKEGELHFAVTLFVERDDTVKAVTSTVRVQLRADPRGGGAEPVPAMLLPYAVDRLRVEPSWEPVPPAADPARGELLEQLTANRNAFAWKWRIPYFYCHFTERMQMSGYLRQMEEVVDLFLAERGISIKRLLDEQNWIPVVPHSRITLLDEAWMEEELYTVFTVEEIFKNFTYRSRMDTYVVRDGALVQTATGEITHGYAVIESRRDWSLVSFDERMVAGLSGASGNPVAGRGTAGGSRP